MKNAPIRDLIFDLGMHHAEDTEFYLKKGFQVVALEANPAMTEAARVKFADHIASGRLSIVEKALWEKEGETVNFYINMIKDDWSSVSKGWAEKGGHTSTKIEVESLTLQTLFNNYGVPYYIKCDIEGADKLFTEQLLYDDRRPAFVSVEAIALDLLSNLSAAGYERFQIINQALSWAWQPPSPPLEGEFVSVRFNGYMSGLFGRELDTKRWITFEEASKRYLLFRMLKATDDTLAHGWLDFHATHSRYLT